MGSRTAGDRGGAVEAVMSALVLERGFSDMSLRTIASGIGIAPSTLVAQFTHRARLLQWFCAVSKRRRTARLDAGMARRGVEGLLPQNDESLAAESVWSAVCELGRTDAVVSEVVQWQHQDEREAVAHALRLAAHQRGDLDSSGRGVPPHPDEVELLAALIAGLRSVMVRSLDPMSLAEATRLLSIAERSSWSTGASPTPPP